MAKGPANTPSRGCKRPWRPVIPSPFPFGPDSIRAVFTDLDDTLTLHGQLPSAALVGLEKLKAAGKRVGVVSGCSYGWGACLIRLLPVDLFIVENGGAYFTKEKGTVQSVDVGRYETRKDLSFLFSKLQREFPELSLSQDDGLRRFDCAIDIGQEKHVAPEIVDALLNRLQSENGVNARPSSIHINFWKGAFSKASTLQRWCEQHGIKKDESLYVGDSLNDEPLFAEYRMSVGVANVRKHLQKMKTPPAWILEGEGGEGFAELVGLICRR